MNLLMHTQRWRHISVSRKKKTKRTSIAVFGENLEEDVKTKAVGKVCLMAACHVIHA